MSLHAPAAPPYRAPKRRRIYLMRHGDVAYFNAQGARVGDPDQVILSEKGRAQAGAAGRYFTHLGIEGFDRVITSTLPRTIETAALVLAAAGIAAAPEPIAGLREIKGGDHGGIETQHLPAAFLGVSAARVTPDTRFMGGESVGEMQTRVFEALDAVLADTDWDTALFVLHGLVNTAIISRALTGDVEYFGQIEASPGSINILDAGTGWTDWAVRAVNICPDPSGYGRRRLRVMEAFLLQALKGRG